jgi:thymidylate kinase
MDFYRENKIFSFSCIFASGCSLYLLYDIVRKTRKINRILSKNGEVDSKTIDQKLCELCVPTPTKLHPYQKKLGNYTEENANSSFAPNLPGIAHSMIKSGENLIFRICLTGGPSSGKTTAKAVIAERLSERGIRVINVPLTPTLTIENGFGTTMPNLSKDDLIKYQISLMKMQMNLEDFFTDIALLGQEKAVILCDRGVMDSQAYVTKEEWQMILDENDWNLVNLRDRRYDAVIHIVTSANGAEDYFKSENKELDPSSKVIFLTFYVFL